MTKEQKWRTFFIAMQLIIIVVLVATYFIYDGVIKTNLRTIAYLLLIGLLILRFVRPALLKRKRDSVV